MSTGPVELQGITINAGILETLQGFSTQRNVLKGITIGVGTGASIMQMKVVDKNHEPIEGATCRVLNAALGSNNVPYFDLVDDRIDVAHNANFQGAEITYEFLYYSEGWGSTHNAFIAKRTANTNGFFIFRLATTGRLYFDFNGSSNRWDTGYSLPLNEWKRITLTRTASGRKLYVDGSFVVSTTSAGTVPTATGIMRFGANSQSLQLFFGGNMSDIRVWNKERTPEEIAADWNKRLAGDETGLVEYWKLNEGDGTTALATVNSSNDGTIFGATWQEADVSFPLFDGSIQGYEETPYDTQTTNANGLCTLNYQINTIHGLEVTLPGKRRFIMPFQRTTRGLLDWQVMLSDYLATFATDKGNILINSEPENNDANFLIE